MSARDRAIYKALERVRVLESRVRQLHARGIPLENAQRVMLGKGLDPEHVTALYTLNDARHATTERLAQEGQR